MVGTQGMSSWTGPGPYLNQADPETLATVAMKLRLINKLKSY